MKKRDFVVLGIEIIALLIAIVCLFIKKPTVVYDANEFYWADAKTIQSDIKCVKHGVYNVKLHYNSSVDYLNTVIVTADGADYDTVKTNTVLLYENLSETSYNCAITHTNNTVRIKVLYGGEGNIEIYGAELVPTNIPARIALFWIVLISIMLNGIYMLKRKGAFENIENRKVIVLLACCLVFSCVPMMLNYIGSAGDLGYHYMRIGGLAEALKSGQLPVRLYPKWLFGYGYADAVMYGHTLLYIPAIMRLIGFSITFSYQVFLFVINLLTTVISYYSFGKAFNSKSAGVLGAYLYTLMPYRLFAMYTAAVVGIVSAGVFLPLVFLGLYKIFTDDNKSANYKYNWIYVSIGLVGVISNHTLSTEILCGFILLTCLLMIKRVIKLPVFISLLKALAGFIVLGLWFIVPFIDNYLNYDFHIKNVSARVIQDRGVLPSEFFTLLTKVGTHNYYGTQGLKDATIMTPGLAVTAGLLVFIALAFVYKDFRSNEFKKGLFFVVISSIAAFMSTLFFPWDWIQRRGQIFATLVSSLQFPTRFLIFYGILVIPLSCIVYGYLKDKGVAGRIYFGIVLAMCLIQLSSFSTETTYMQSKLELYDNEEMGTGYTSGGEYLPQSIYGIDNEVLKFQDAQAGNDVLITDYAKDDLYAELKVNNIANEASYVDVPLLNYIGYTAYDVNTKDKIQIIEGDTANIRLVIPAGYDGDIVVKYVGKWYWRLCDAISALALVGLGFYLWRMKKKHA